jgi:hypothetical protein
MRFTRPLAIMPSADQVPIESPHSTMLSFCLRSDPIGFDLCYCSSNSQPSFPWMECLCRALAEVLAGFMVLDATDCTVCCTRYSHFNTRVDARRPLFVTVFSFDPPFILPCILDFKDYYRVYLAAQDPSLSCSLSGSADRRSARASSLLHECRLSG